MFVTLASLWLQLLVGQLRVKRIAQAHSLRAGSFKVGRELRSLPRSPCAWLGPESRECVRDTNDNDPQESTLSTIPLPAPNCTDSWEPDAHREHATFATFEVQ